MPRLPRSAEGGRGGGQYYNAMHCAALHSALHSVLCASPIGHGRRQTSRFGSDLSTFFPIWAVLTTQGRMSARRIAHWLCDDQKRSSLITTIIARYSLLACFIERLGGGGGKICVCHNLIDELISTRVTLVHICNYYLQGGDPPRHSRRGFLAFGWKPKRTPGQRPNATVLCRERHYWVVSNPRSKQKKDLREKQEKREDGIKWLGLRWQAGKARNPGRQRHRRGFWRDPKAPPRLSVPWAMAPGPRPLTPGQHGL